MVWYGRGSKVRFPTATASICEEKELIEPSVAGS